MTINERTARVQLMLGNRSDLTSRVITWLVDAYRDMAFSFDFAELEDTANILTVPNIDTYDYMPQWRGVKSVFLQISTWSRRLRKRDIRVMDAYPPTPGVPTIYANYGSKLLLKPIPNDSYTLLLRVWNKPVIADTASETVISIPEDWMEVLDYMAVLRGHTELLERDKAQEVRTILYGALDPRSGKILPGLIKEKMTQKQAEYADEEWGIRPRIVRYTNIP